MATIAKLLVDLAGDAALLERFSDDPQAVMAEYDLTEGQQTIILSGDLGWIRRAIDYEYATGATEALPGFGHDAAVAMIVTWRPLWAPTWINPPPEPT